MNERALCSCHLQNERGQLSDGQFLRIAQIYGVRQSLFRANEPHKAIDEIIDIKEGACLRPAAVDGYRLTSQGLEDHIGDNSPVTCAQARSIGVEDACNPNVRHPE